MLKFLLPFLQVDFGSVSETNDSAHAIRPAHLLDAVSTNHLVVSALIVKLMRTVLFKSKKLSEDANLKESMYGIYEESPELFEFFGGQKKMLDCIIEGCRKLVSKKRHTQVSLMLLP